MSRGVIFRLFSYALVIAFLLIANATAYATVVYVDATATGSDNGTSWADAYPDMQSALGSAVSGDSIWVAGGTYKPTPGSDRTATFQLVNGVGVYGGFAGTETVLSQRDWVMHVTILSGDIGVLADNTDNSYHVVTGSANNATAVLDGFTVTGGNADGAYPYERGGGMLCDNSGDPTLTNVIFSNNSAILDGGGVYHVGTNLPLTNVTFNSNSANRNGGGMFDRGRATLTDVSFENNYGGNGGGGLYAFNSQYWLTNVTFTNNQSSFGGGIYIDEHVSSGPATLTNVTFTSNSAAGSGGGIYNSRGFNPSLTNVRFNDNTAGASGGGMYNEISSPVLTNVVFSGNTAEGDEEFGDGGGGMYNETSYPTLTNVTFGNNSAGLYGAGGGMLNNVSSRPILVNTILWGNTADFDAQIGNFDIGSVPTISYSLIESSGGSGGGWDAGLGTDGGNNIDADAMFKGASWPSAPFSVWSSSSAVDAGNDGAVPVGVTTDIDGNPRIVGTVDMGAYEHQGPPTGIDDEGEGSMPTALRSVYPNPFNPMVTVEFDVVRQQHVEMTIYDLRGKRVRTLVNEVREPGAHRLIWDGRDNGGSRVATGVYFLRFRSDGNTTYRKLVMLK